MKKFREKSPERTCGKKFKNYSSYRKYLIKDFNGRCGYCDRSHDLSNSSFHIDHFAPKRHFPALENEYSNLIYACPICNLAKKDNWISTVNPKPSNDGKIGFIDPCEIGYDENFKRGKNGKIIPQTQVAEYMLTELKMYLRDHEICWTMERLKKLIYNRDYTTLSKEELQSQLKLRDIALDLYEEILKR